MAASTIQDDLRDRSTGDLVKDLSNQVTTLVHKEVELAKAEMAEKARKAGLGIGLLTGAAVAGLLTLGVSTAFLVALLALAMPVWAAALVVAAVWALTAALLALLGVAQLREAGKPVPEETVESVKEDVRWLKGQS
jgi:uncharacterized membrane protein YqjE